MEHKWTLQSLEKVFTDLAIQEASAVPSLDTDLSGARHRQSVENATEYRARIVKRQRQTFVQNRVPLGTPPGTDELDMPAEDEDRPDNRSESPRPPHGEVLGQANSMLSLVALANANQLLKRLRPTDEQLSDSCPLQSVNPSTSVSTIERH